MKTLIIEFKESDLLEITEDKFDFGKFDEKLYEIINNVLNQEPIQENDTYLSGSEKIHSYEYELNNDVNDNLLEMLENKIYEELVIVSNIDVKSL